MIQVTHELSCCVDCLMLVANGEGTDENAARIAARWNDAEQRGMVAACLDDHDEFSWSPCQVCGSTLGGERHHINILQEVKE